MLILWLACSSCLAATTYILYYFTCTREMMIRAASISFRAASISLAAWITSQILQRAESKTRMYISHDYYRTTRAHCTERMKMSRMAKDLCSVLCVLGAQESVSPVPIMSLNQIKGKKQEAEAKGMSKIINTQPRKKGIASISLSSERCAAKKNKIKILKKIEKVCALKARAKYTKTCGVR